MAEEAVAEAPDRLRRAEAILMHRTGRFAVVLERVSVLSKQDKRDLKSKLTRKHI